MDGPAPVRIPGWGALSADFSPNGDIVALGDRDGGVKLVDAKDGTLIKSLAPGFGKDVRVNHVVYSPRGHYVASAANGIVIVWDVDDGSVVNRFTVPDTEEIVSLEYSPDGESLITAFGAGYPTAIWDSHAGKEKLSLGDAKAIHKTAFFSPDQTRIVTTEDNTVRVWDSNTGAALAWFGPHGGTVNFAEFTPDSKSIVSVSIDGDARVWRPTGLKPGNSFEVACRRLRSTDQLGSIAHKFGLEGLKPICSEGHAPLPYIRRDQSE